MKRHTTLLSQVIISLKHQWVYLNSDQEANRRKEESRSWKESWIMTTVNMKHTWCFEKASQKLWRSILSLFKMDCSVLSQQKGWPRWNQWVIQAATQKWKGNWKQGRGQKLSTLNKNSQNKDQHTERSILTLKETSIQFILAAEQIIVTNCHHWSHIWKHTSSEAFLSLQHKVQREHH